MAFSGPSTLGLAQRVAPEMASSKEQMWRQYTPWVLRTYGDSAKTKTITRLKYARIVGLLRNDSNESNGNGELAKFRLWARSKGFVLGNPRGADAQQLYLPTGTDKNSEGKMGFVYKKVAVVEDFFDIIYSVHVESEGDTQLRGRAGKHCGQKRTYRAIADQYAFIPREAISKFLLYCTECAHKGSAERRAALLNQGDTNKSKGNSKGNNNKGSNNKAGNNKAGNNKAGNNKAGNNKGSLNKRSRKRKVAPDSSSGTDITNDISGSDVTNGINTVSKECVALALANAWQHYCPPLMRQALGLANLANLAVTNSPQLLPVRRLSAFTPTPAFAAMNNDDHEENEDSDKEELHIDTEQDRSDDTHSNLSENNDDKETHEIDVDGDNKDSNDDDNNNVNSNHFDKDGDNEEHNEGAEREDNDADEPEPKSSPEPELNQDSKASDLFVRLFVDENLDLAEPLSNQSPSKVEAITEACSRQFPENDVESTRKRINHYLENGRSCSKRPATPPSPRTASVVARACHNEAENAKRIRFGLEPLTGHETLTMDSKSGLAGVQNSLEAMSVRQLIGGYRESAAFLLRSADELEMLINRQLAEDQKAFINQF